MIELGAKPLRLVLLKERQKRANNKRVENFSRRIGVHDVEDGVPLDMAVTALIEIEDDAPIPTLPQ